MGYLLAALLLSALVGHIIAHGDPTARRRKSLDFRPVHPHAVFHSTPQANDYVHALPDIDADPFDVARRFIERVSRSGSSEIRKDSYTDLRTGVSHIYVRQIVNGLEVVDGVMNLNVKDGVVLSYGNSFYDGILPVPFTPANPDTTRSPHREYCASLAGELDSLAQSLDEQKLAPETQHPLDGSRSTNAALQAKYSFVNSLHYDTCRFVDLPASMADQSNGIDDVRAALLQLMIAATPSLETELDLVQNHDEHKTKMSVSPVADKHVVLIIDNVPGAISPVKAKLSYNQVLNAAGDATDLELVWKFEVEMADNWYEATVSASAPHHIISIIDWTSDSPMVAPTSSNGLATYNVFAWGVNDPSLGNRSFEQERGDTLASPVGWHSLPFSNDPISQGVQSTNREFYRNTTTTWGNNILAQENWDGQHNLNTYKYKYRPDAGPERIFDYEYDPQATNTSDAVEEAKKYINATVTQLFYISNMIHDLYYRYGFDEVSGNFQQYNFDRGGQEDDGIIVYAQDGSGFNDAKFVAPPDGTNGRCHMHLWDTANPYRDGDLDAGILIHELTHGLSARLIGGPSNPSCVGQSGESGGMGEGWSDFFATAIISTEDVTDYTMGSWTSNVPTGARPYPYSLNETINPVTYKTLDELPNGDVHSIGSVWAEILWVVSHHLIAEHGFSHTLFPPPPLADGTIPEGDFYRTVEYTASGVQKALVPKHGNTLSLQLILNGLKLQSCHPTFIQARNAIIQADDVLTGGENQCTLWRGFARRGLGADAKLEKNVRTEDFSVPATCK